MSGVGDSAAQCVQERDDTFCLKQMIALYFI